MEGEYASVQLVPVRKEVSGPASMSSNEDFTEASYRKALRLARSSYSFAPFTSPPASRQVLWRHDVDFSVHRALRLAEIEAEEGVQATYFLYLHSQFYNLLSGLVLPKAKRILELGHHLGLHFDPTFYGLGLAGAAFQKAVESERTLLADMLQTPPAAVSFHLFGVLEEPPPDNDIVGGMVNVYSRAIMSGYTYCSDSNGVWRHARLFDVLERAEADRLHVLTHPEWWTPEAMAPRARIQRCLDGMAGAIGTYYDELVDGYGRPNVR
jgi:hypothetical protein